jgi:hypothetical protein
MKKRILASFATLHLAIGITILTTGTAASAHPSGVTDSAEFAQPLAFTDCPQGVACVWTDANGEGAQLNLPFSIEGQGVCHNFSEFGSTWVNTISSVQNTYGNGHSLTLYYNRDCPVIGISLTVGFSQQNLNSWDNDNMESFKIN